MADKFFITILWLHNGILDDKIIFVYQGLLDRGCSKSGFSPSTVPALEISRVFETDWRMKRD